jgi:SAM-dependent methyltransferase
MRNDWYTDFFGGLVVEFWAKAIPPEQTQAEINFLHECFAGAQAKCVLDIACGNGRHAVPLAKLGYRMTGLDVSDEFLELARQRSSQENVEVEWRQADMLELPQVAAFDAALCFGNSFGYLDRQGTAQFLSRLATALRPGAPFVVETGAIAESLLPALQPRRWMEMDSILFLSSAEYRCTESRIDITYSLLRGEVRETKQAHLWVYAAGELRTMLERSGFATRAFYGSVAKEEFRLGAPRLVLVAERV